MSQTKNRPSLLLVQDLCGLSGSQLICEILVKTQKMGQYGIIKSAGINRRNLKNTWNFLNFGPGKPGKHLEFNHPN